MNAVSVNKIARTIAALQQVEVGSPEYLAAGPNAKSSDTGGQACYPWVLDMLVTPLYKRGAFANYGSRPCHYKGAGVVLRGVGNENAGRPVDWTPDDAYDITEGWQAGMRVCITSTGFVLVNGIDVQHFHLTPLFAIYDAEPTPLHGLPEVDSRTVAGCFIHSMLDSLAGMVAKLSPAVDDYPGDRATACILKAAAQAMKRGMLRPENAAPIMAYIERAMLIWNAAPHRYPNDKYANSMSPAVTLNPLYVEQTYNGGLGWCIPGLRMLKNLPVKALPAGDFRTRIEAALKMWCQRLLCIEKLVPGGGGAKVAAVSFPDKMLGVAPQDWSLLTKANLHYTDNAEWWLVHSYAIAADELANQQLADARDVLVDKWAAQYPGWCVGANGALLAAKPKPVVVEG